MKRNIFAVCDLEVDYALNFMDYMNRKKNIPFEIQAFTSVENLIAYGKQTHIELLLISGRAMCREVRDLDIGKIIILSEGVHPPELDASIAYSAPDCRSVAWNVLVCRLPSEVWISSSSAARCGTRMASYRPAVTVGKG